MTSIASAPVREQAADMLQSLRELRAHALATERACAADVDLVAPEHRPSARNLLHYLALRQHDLRDLQGGLARLGLSSLGRTEAHVLAGLDAVIAILERLALAPPGAGEGSPADGAGDRPVDHETGPAALAANTDALLGPAVGRPVRIMVTMPTEAASDPLLVRRLVEAGMDVMRVNCAHDGPSVWEDMIRHLRAATEELHRPCRVLIDLAGPKLRTGAIEGDDRTLRVKPAPARRGADATPARLWLAGPDAPEGPPEGAPAGTPVLRVDRALLDAAREGDRLRLTDARGRRRKLRVREAGPDGRWTEATRSAWIEAGAPLELRRDGQTVARSCVGPLPARDDAIHLEPGDTLLVTPAGTPGRPARRDEAGRVVEPARIPCTLAEVFRDVRAGERIWFDDGRIGGVVGRADRDGLDVSITHAPPGGGNLRADRGINLPDSALDLPALTAKDIADLGFAAAHADMVALSFVRSPEDVALLVRELDARSAPHLGIVLKIETRAAFERLPRLLLAALRSPPVGVMVARGDLAVECGFERLAEAQEEILWLSEAAHVPVIWATQVLESLAKLGQPSRAEVTDAAMSGRAECVMLNKGPHIVEAVRFLGNVLDRMQAHQRKKRAMLRKLSVSRVPGRPQEPAD